MTLKAWFIQTTKIGPILPSDQKDRGVPKTNQSEGKIGPILAVRVNQTLRVIYKSEMPDLFCTMHQGDQIGQIFAILVTDPVCTS
jgi:hypothetical protein